MSQKTINLAALGQVTDTSYGRSGTFGDSSSVKIRLHSNKMFVTFTVVTNVNGQLGMINARRRCEEEAHEKIKLTLDRVKNDYKELTGDKLTLKHLDTVSSIEAINCSAYTASKTVLYRMVAFVEVI